MPTTKEDIREWLRSARPGSLRSQLAEHRAYHIEEAPAPVVEPVQALPEPAPLYDPGATSLNLNKVHELKCDPEPFQAVYLGSKTFEVRVNDRDYMQGDSLHLREYDRATGKYTGRWVSKRVVYLLQGGQYGLPENLCVMGLA
jgi:hypothetical protein